MSKFILIPLIAILFISCSTGHKRVRNDWTSMNLKGKVKSILETYYPATKKNGKLEKNEKSSNSANKLTYSFNTDGNLTEMLGDIPSDGLGAMRHEIKYDENGKKTEWVIYNNDGSVQGKSIYKYDPQGYISEENRYSQGWGAVGDVTYQGKLIYKYDELGNKIGEYYFGKDGSSGDTTTYKYDKSGYLVQAKTGGHISTYTNDEKGNPIEVTLELTEKYSYVYDKEGNWIVKENLETFAELTFIIEREIKYY